MIALVFVKVQVEYAAKTFATVGLLALIVEMLSMRITVQMSKNNKFIWEKQVKQTCLCVVAVALKLS